MNKSEAHNIMDRKCMVTIIYTTYNHENYVAEAIDSFIKQKTAFEFEIIIHDDASDDSTQNIIKDYEQKYPGLILSILQKENQWAKKEKHMWTDITFPKARGKYIALCDGDDYWTDPFKLQKQYDFMEQNPGYSFCFHNALVIDNENKSKPHLFNSLEEKRVHDFKSLVNRDWYIATSSLFFLNLKTEYPKWFRTVGGNNDYTLELLLARNGPFFYMPDVMSVYRVLPNSISTAFGLDFIFLYTSLISVLQKTKYVYPIESKNVFDNKITELEDKKKKLERRLRYPILKLVKLKTYSKFIGRLLNIQTRVEE